MASLFVIQGPDQGKRFQLAGETVTLGRDKSNAVQLADHEVSRRHAELHLSESGYELVDLDSSNGTFVNGRRVTRQPLSSGDRIQAGRSLLIFTVATPGEHETPENIDIVGRDELASESRIVRSVASEEGSRLFRPGVGEESPWLARARSNLEVMYHTALATSHTLDIGQLLRRIMELVFEWVEADRGCIMLVDPETDELAPAVRRNRPGVQVDQRMVISRTILDYVMQQREGVLTSDASEDDRWDAAGSIMTLGIREAICVPMQGRYGIVGVIYIDTYTPPGDRIGPARNHFQEDHLKLMVAIGHQAALAIEDTRYYSAMVQAERLAAIGQTIASLSHHIKNILQGIRGGSYLIEEGLKEHEWEPVEKGWSIVERNQDRISNLVMDMLSYSKDRKPEIAAADLNEVVADVIGLLQSRAAGQQTQLVWNPGSELPQLYFDEAGIHRAVLNVVTNALDACEQAPQRKVEVATRYDAGQQEALIVVKDSGVGIEEEDLVRIFSPFESRKGQRGTGLGLPVSRKILREHEGDIEVTSSPGAGACFTLRLPMLAPRAPS